MNAFEIHKSDIAIRIDDLDREAAESFGVEYNKKNYASPYPDYMSGCLHWYDIIGFAIATLPLGEHTWEEVKKAYDKNGNNEAYAPFHKLCDEWKEKGYAPVTVK